ncbi:MAG: P-loop NTPase [Calditrichaceae bacterium]|nr:Mrp/NBP35 family ATP-binding protein [Calditrichia bacterium]NUQ40400.1 P-loop NTPase [Calditrichaceae bacterium]
MKRYQDIAGDGGSNIVAQVAEQAGRVKSRMAAVRRIIAVMSGKGGVGKSSVTVNLAAALALEGAAVGILDADINGPSIAKMAGVRGRPLLQGDNGVVPPAAALGIKVMSMDLFLPDDQTPVLWQAPGQKDAYTWRGMMEAAALREFLADTEWGALDFLFIDLPPGSDKLPNLADLLPRLDGVVAVSIPSGVSRLVVARSITVAVELLNAPLIGLVENMAAYVCAHCGREEEMFPPARQENTAEELKAPLLGKIPFDPRIARAGDEGRLFLNDHAHTPAGRAIRQIAGKVKAFL